MAKNRLVAFTDAVLAIIMTILILELEKPAEPTWEAILALKQGFFAYALSFFWLGTMWINLHNEWHEAKVINKKVIWWNVILLFFSSFFPYVTSFVSNNFRSSVAQGVYGIIVLLVTISSIFTSAELERANLDREQLKEIALMHREKLYLDILIKVIGITVALTIYPPAMMMSVLITMILILIPKKLKLSMRHHKNN